MPKLKVLSDHEVLAILSSFGFVSESQRGSHAEIRRVLPAGTRQSLTIPLHRELDRGTLLAIYRQALRFIPEEKLQPHFYT